MLQKIKVNLYRFLRSTEKYSGTDNVYLFKGAFWLTLLRVVSVLCGLLLSVVFANLLSKDAYGNFKYILSLAGILGAFSLTGMNTVVTQAVARGFEGALRQSFAVQLRWNCLVLVMAGGLSLYYFFNHNLILAASLLAVGVFSPLLLSANTYVAFLNGKKDYRHLFRYSTASNIVYCVLMAAALFLTKKVVLLVVIYFAVNTFINLWFYIKTLAEFKPNQKIDSKSIPAGKGLSLINILVYSVPYIDKVIVFHYLGAPALAVYYFATVIPEQLQGFFKVLPILSLPNFATRSKKSIKAMIFGKLVRLSAVVVIAILGYVLMAPFIYKFFFPQYLESIFYSQIFSSVLLFAALSLFLLSVFQAHTEIRSLAVFHAVSSAVQILLMWGLLTLYGIVGLIWARLITSALNFLLLVILLRRI